MAEYTADKLIIDIEGSAGKAANEVDRLVNSLNRMKSATGGMKDPKTKVSVDTKDVDKATEKVSKLTEVMTSLKRIAMYRILRTVIKEVTQAFKEGLENAYEYSKLTGGELAASLDRVATASAQMKNQLGAAFGTFLQWIEPLLVQVIHLVTKLAQAFTWLFAVLSGSDTYLVANEVATAWGEADKKAKAYKKTLLGIDEINRLNDPNSGSGKTTPDYGSMFHEEKVNIPDWLSPFIDKWGTLTDKISAALDAIKAFVKELVAMPSPEIEIGASTNGVADAVGAVRTILKPLLQASPYILTIGLAMAGNPLAKIAGLSTVIMELLENSPYIVTLRGEVESPVPQVETITDALQEQTAKQENIFTTAYQHITSAIQEWQANYAIAKDNANAYANSIDASIDMAMSNAYQNIVTFVTEAGAAFGEWAANAANAASECFTNIAQNVYSGLQSAANNVTTFINETGAGIHDWAVSSSEAFRSWAKGVAENAKSALTTAWENFRSFALATGESIKNAFSAAAPVIVPVAISAAAITAAIALAPYTGGGSLALAAFANGGYPQSGQLFLAREAGAEMVGSIGGHTAVANNDQIVEGISEGVRDANTEVLTAIISGVSQIVGAIREGGASGGVDIDMLASALYQPMQRQGQIHGNNLVAFTR